MQIKSIKKAWVLLFDRWLGYVRQDKQLLLWDTSAILCIKSMHRTFCFCPSGKSASLLAESSNKSLQRCLTAVKAPRRQTFPSSPSLSPSFFPSSFPPPSPVDSRFRRFAADQKLLSHPYLTWAAKGSCRIGVARSGYGTLTNLLVACHMRGPRIWHAT